MTIPTLRRWGPRALAGFVAGGLLACSRTPDAAPPNDTEGAEPTPRVAAPADGDSAAGAASWPDALGAFLVVPAGGGRDGLLLLRAAAAGAPPGADVLAAVRGASVDLLTTGGDVSHARIAGIATGGETECGAGPRLLLELVGGGGGAAWSLGISAGRLRPLPLQAIETMPSRDSARLAIELARLASTVPDDPASAFRGLPVVVRSARRFAPEPGVTAVVAEFARRVAQEAQPLEERLTIVAERADAASTWQLAWSVRVDGLEEAIESSDVLAALAGSADEPPMLVLQRDGPSGTRYEVLVRTGPAAWTRRWMSDWSGC